jgi:hypothetical protein
VNQQELHAGHHHLQGVQKMCTLLEAVRGGGKGIKDHRISLRRILILQPYVKKTA